MTVAPDSRRRLRRWQLAGAAFVVVTGALLHFAWEASGRSDLVAIFAPVNESVWEHLKMAFWPALLWALVERWALRGRVRNALIAKTLEVWIACAGIVLLFYGYVALLGHHVLALDVTVFVVAVALAFTVSARVMQARRLGPFWRGVAATLLATLALALAAGAWVTPRVALFRDARTGGYGIDHAVGPVVAGTTAGQPE